MVRIKASSPADSSIHEKTPVILATSSPGTNPSNHCMDEHHNPSHELLSGHGSQVHGTSKDLDFQTKQVKRHISTTVPRLDSHS